ncbi:uncharacterized protein LOC143039019 [Oratosquilla oratoria]|uniref:uncharacterized protein LOC143039019 n=1 Tax=Oratosquilla oratoria TaxID=337810 RepID=UPI003F76EDBB
MAAAKKGKTQAEQDAIDHDILFMKSMLTDRTATFSGVNKVLARSIKKRQERQIREKVRQNQDTCDYEENVVADNYSPISTDEDNNTDEFITAEPKRKHRSKVKEGVSIFVPHDILKSKELVSCSKGGPHKDVISTATKQLLMDWKCEENVVGMIFDTAPSNTGQKAGACVSLQKELGRALFWFACRRHVGEVILSACWDCLKVEGSSGPTIMLFKRFKNHFSKLVGYNDKNKYYYPTMPGVFEERQQEMANFFRKSLSKPFARGDYKELVELCLLFVTKGSEPVKFTMVRPGALHKARWMAKLLYTLKIVLLSVMIQEQFPRAEIATETQISKLELFAVFTVEVYAP